MIAEFRQVGNKASVLFSMADTAVQTMTNRDPRGLTRLFWSIIAHGTFTQGPSRSFQRKINDWRCQPASA